MILDESNDSYTEHVAQKSSNPVKQDFLTWNCGFYLSLKFIVMKIQYV